MHAIAMVYVPEGPFKVGTGKPSGVYQTFADGPDMPSVHNMHNSRHKDQEFGGLTDGAWRGGNSVPCLIDAEWNAPAKEGTRARRIGGRPGEQLSPETKTDIVRLYERYKGVSLLAWESPGEPREEDVETS